MNQTGLRRRAVMQGGPAPMASTAVPAAGEATEAYSGFSVAFLDCLQEPVLQCALPIKADISGSDCTTLDVPGMNPAIWIPTHDDGMIDVAWIGRARAGACCVIRRFRHAGCKRVDKSRLRARGAGDPPVVEGRVAEEWYCVLTDWINSDLAVATYVGLRGVVRERVVGVAVARWSKVAGATRRPETAHAFDADLTSMVRNL